MSKTKTALRIYLERGQSALRALEAQTDGNIADDFTHALGQRDAAFHNFRSLDAMLVAAGQDIAEDAESRLVAQEIELVNTTIVTLLDTALNRLGGTLGKVRNARAGAKAYHSGHVTDHRLVKRA